MKPIQTAICSYGMSGSVFHAPFLEAHPGFCFYGVWERSKNLASQRYPSVKTFRTLGELLDDTAIELVVVNTPSVTHFEYTRQTLEAGKHVVCEKPFTVTVAQANELIELARRNKCKLSVFQNRRYDSDYRTVKSIIDQQLLGRIIEAEFHYDRYSEEISSKVHKETPVQGTGALYDLGSHLIDQALQLFSTPIALFADLEIMRPVSRVADYFELLLYYPTMRVRLKSSYQVREPLPGYVLHGSKGSFIKPKTDVQEEQLQAGKWPTDPEYGVEPESQKGFLHTEVNGMIIKEFIPSFKGNYSDYYEGIFQSIRNNAPLPVTAEAGMQVIQIIEAALQSNHEKRVIELGTL